MWIICFLPPSANLFGIWKIVTTDEDSVVDKTAICVTALGSHATGNIDISWTASPTAVREFKLNKQNKN